MNRVAKFSITVHPAAAVFPMLSDEEIAELGASITKFGLREPIQALSVAGNDVTNWIVIDGRNRLEALRRAGVSDEDIAANYMKRVNLQALHASPEEYVMMANIERRNLTQAQRRDLAGKLALMISEAQKDKPRTEQVDALGEAAKKAGVSRRTAANARAEVVPEKPTAKPPAKRAWTPMAGPTVIARLGIVRDDLKKGGVKALQTWKVGDLKTAHANATAIVGILELIPGVGAEK